MSSSVLVDGEGDVEVKASGVDPNRWIVNREDVEGMGAGAPGAFYAVGDVVGELNFTGEVGIWCEGIGAILIVDESAGIGLNGASNDRDGFAFYVSEVGGEIAGVDGVGGVFFAIR